MNGRFVKILAVAAFGSAVMFGAQVTVSLGSNPFPTGNVGPYIATVGGITEFVFCDDEAHSVYPNETWTATVTTLSSLAALGNSNIGSGSSVAFKALPSAATLYERVAWLVNRFGSFPADASGLQHAIWDIFLHKGGTGLNTDPTTDAYWLTQSAANYTKLTAAQVANTFILTPVAGSQRPLVDGMPQEFFYVTPEPATYAMFGIALVLLSLGTFRRKSNKRD